VVTSKPGRFFPEKEPRYRWNRTLVGPQSQCGACGEEKSFLPLPEFELRIASHEPDNIKIVDLGNSEKKVLSSSHSSFTEFERGWLIHDSRMN